MLSASDKVQDVIAEDIVIAEYVISEDIKRRVKQSKEVGI